MLTLAPNNQKIPPVAQVFSRQPVKDFELEFDIKIGKDTGIIPMPVSIQVRGQKEKLSEKSEFLVGYQVDVRPKVCGDLHHRSVKEPLRRVKVSPAPHSPGTGYRRDDFNHVHIRCVGKRLTVQLNAYITLDETLTDMPESGILSIHWGNFTEVLLQNVRMRDLVGIAAPPAK
jgi:hypothetical protein